MADLVLIDTADRVRTVTLNRPEARNALSVALQREAGAALAAADADPGVDAVIFTGSDPAFCAGLDLRELGKDGSNLVGGADDPAISPFAALWNMTKPVIGAINGPCVTGGFELALACDFLIASERAAFADTHARVGVMPAGGMSVFLPKVVGIRKAKEMSLSGNFMGAHEAFARGLVNHVVKHEDLLPAARKLAGDIVGNDQAAVRNLKKLYNANEKVTVGAAIDQEQEYFRAWRIDPAEIERRRAGIVERGRDQQ
ncbi:MAG: enoyl-CoA hydratase [Acidimicrobiia bacterium]